jgi:hypothetical protein
MSGFVLGGEIDGSNPAICAIMETFQCAPGQECVRGNAESVNLPYFPQVNFQKKKALVTRGVGRWPKENGIGHFR